MYMPGGACLCDTGSLSMKKKSVISTLHGPLQANCCRMLVTVGALSAAAAGIMSAAYCLVNQQKLCAQLCQHC